MNFAVSLGLCLALGPAKTPPIKSYIAIFCRLFQFNSLQIRELFAVESIELQPRKQFKSQTTLLF